MIIANFDKGSTREDVFRIYQYDYGQVLRIQGLTLPTAVEVHFSLQNTGGEATTRIGVTKDGVTDVVIPDSLLENGDIAQDYEIYAFVYLRNETSGQTEYKITLHITSRPKPEAFDRPEDAEIFKEAIKAVNESAARSAESEKQAEGWAHGREDLPERAQDNAKYYSDQAREDSVKTDADRKEVGRLVESVSGIGEQVEKVEGLTKQAQTSATNAALSEQAAKESENNAAQARAGAEAAEDNAELAAQKVEQDKAIVEQAKNIVKQMGQEVLDNKNLVDEAAQDFDLKAQQALADVNNAGQAQTERVQTAGNDAVESVKAAQGTATRAVETAKTEAIKVVQTEGATQAGNVSAEGEKQVQAVRGAAQEIIADREQIQTNKKDIADLRQSKAGAIVETVKGSVVQIADSAEAFMEGLRIFGKSEQDGTPTPESPKEIKSIGGNGEVKVNINTGNLFPLNKFKGYEVNNSAKQITLNGDRISFTGKGTTGKEDMVFFLNKEADKLSLPPGKYTLSFKSNKPYGGTNGENTVEMYLIVEKKSGTVYQSTGNAGKRTVDIEDGDKMYFRFDINNNSMGAEFYDIMFNLGDTPLSYESHAEQSLAIQTPNGLPGIPVSSGGNYTDESGKQWICDEIDLGRGKYVQRIKTINAKNIVWVRDPDREKMRYTSIQQDIKKHGGLMSNRFIKNSFSNGPGLCSNEENKKLRCCFDSTFDTLDKVTQFFSENETIFMYEITEPIETDLTPEEIAAYKALHTYYPTTVVTNNANADMQLDYVADTQLYIKKELEKIVSTQIQKTANLLSLMPLSTQAAMIENDTNNILDNMEVEK